MTIREKVRGTFLFLGCVACCVGLLFVPKWPLLGLILAPLIPIQIAYMPVPR